MGGSYSMVEKGYIYILTNPSFPDYVKIGYADGLFRYYEDCPLRLIAIGRPMAGHMILLNCLNNIGGQVSF